MARGGKREGAGRKKGSTNKTTTEVKEAILQAFDKLGGVEYLVEVGKDNPQVFLSILAKVLPKEVVAEVTHKSHEEMLRELQWIRDP